MLRLSIVIPVLGNPNQLDDTLVSVLENRPANCEVLVVHNRPYDDPYKLAGEVQFIQANRKAGLAECLNLGIAACRSPVVHVLQCGIVVQNGWADAALSHFQHADIGGVGVVLLHEESREVISAGIDYRMEGDVARAGQGESPTTVFDAWNGEHSPDVLAAFYRVSAIKRIGGFPTWTHGEFLAAHVAMSLEQAGFHCMIEPESLALANAKVHIRGRSFGHGYSAERLFWHWASRHGIVMSAFAHAALVAGECVISLWRPWTVLQLLGRFCGFLAAMTASKPSLSIDAEDLATTDMAPTSVFVTSCCDSDCQTPSQPSARAA